MHEIFRNSNLFVLALHLYFSRICLAQLCNSFPRSVISTPPPPESHSPENSWKLVVLPCWPLSVNTHLYALQTFQVFSPYFGWASESPFYIKMLCQKNSDSVKHCGTGERNVNQVWGLWGSFWDTNAHQRMPQVQSWSWLILCNSVPVGSTHPRACIHPADLRAEFCHQNELTANKLRVYWMFKCFRPPDNQIMASLLRLILIKNTKNTRHGW